MKMTGVLLPGNRQVEFEEFDVPEPGHGQVLLKMKASSICGSDIRAIYREHLGHGPEAYQGVIAGHEPCGQIVKVGPGVKRFNVGDRVILYHISGCGVCHDCREGYMISCTSPERAAHGWQRDGGHADYCLAEESVCVALPDELSYVDGALVACGFGTAYEALQRVKVSGQDRVLITGIGPVGMAAGLLAKAMGASMVIGADISQDRLDFALEIGAIDYGVIADSDARRDDQGSDPGTRLRGVGRLLRLAPGTSVGAPGHPPLGPGRHGRRRQQHRVRRQPDHHPQPDHHLRLLGHQPGPHGGPGREAGRMGSQARDHRDPSFHTGPGRRGLPGGR